MEMYTRFNRKRIDDRDIDTLIGVSKGLAADGAVNIAEANFLVSWLVQCKSRSDNPLVENLLEKIEIMLADGVIDSDESTELVSTLNQLSGEPSEVGEIAKASTLPLCDPPPSFTLNGKSFLYTGTFAYGPRRLCKEATETQNGVNAKSLTKSLDYLVIGTYVTDSWKHESFGNKIKKAVEYRDKGANISIISEERWADMGNF